MTTDSSFAVEIARDTGRALLELRAEFGPVDHFGRRALMDAGDALAQRMLSGRLSERHPNDSVLSEEAVDSPARLAADRVWIIDPLDGTSEFGQGRDDFAVHVALWERSAGPGGALTAGAVDVPALGETWSTAVAGSPRPLPTDRALRIVVSRSRPPAHLDQLLEDASADLAAAGITSHGMAAARVGSVGAKVGEVLAGRAEAYLHNGGLNEWDLAAPYVCARGNGLVALGQQQPFNQMPPTAGPVLICHPAIADVMAAAWHVTR